MTGDARAEIVNYLRLETLAFIAGHISSFAVVVFVVAGKPAYILVLTVGRTILTIVTDLFFIPAFGVNGVAVSNIVIDLFAGLICFALVECSTHVVLIGFKRCYSFLSFRAMIVSDRRCSP